VDLTYGAEYEAFRTEVRTFLEANWPPNGEASDRTRAEREQRFRQLATDAGYLYRSVPKRFGGSEQPPDSLGDYHDRSHGSEPIVLRMAHAPTPRNNGTQSARDLYRLDRHRVYGTPFSTYETEIKKQLTAMFGAKGFDAERDIEAITVNRWSHGYAYDYMARYDPEWEAGQAPHELGRAPIGRIHIANSDSEASAYLHAAIDAAWRAVGEIA